VEDFMHTTVGIFSSRAQAEQAIEHLLAGGTPANTIHYFTGECAPEEIEALRTTDAEAPGMGKAMGAFLGGVIGASGGLSVGSAVASVLIPGVGPIMAVGLGAAAVLGAGGAAAGARVGHKSEDALDEGIPRDDVFFYRDLLKQGRSLVIVNSADDHAARDAREMIHTAGAEDADAARRRWAGSHPEGLRRAS
jgi:hypothetical protein